MLGKIGNRYQTYYTVYKMHAMATHHRGAGHHIARDNLHIEPIHWLQKQLAVENLGKKLKIYYGSNCAVLISIPIPYVSWISKRRKRNPLQHTSTDPKLKQKDATSQMMLPLLGFL